MNKLNKTKRNHLLLVAIGTVAAVSGLYFIVISAQKEALIQSKARLNQMHDRLTKAEALLRLSGEIEETLQAHSAELSCRETGMAPERDSYGWMLVETLTPFMQSRKGINIPGVSQPELRAVPLIPKFPYKSQAFHLKGAGFYHELGRCVADLENKFPYFRIQNLDMAPMNDGDRLSFSFDLVTLVRPTAIEAK